MPPPLDAGRLQRVAATLLLALLAAAVALALRVPLPWMIGPLLATGLCGVAGLPVAGSNRLRNAGQWMIGVALGLYFTPSVVALLLSLAPAVALGVLWALLLGYGFYRFLHRVNGCDRASAYFAAAIGGASEMAVLAERHDGRVDRVAAAHSLRVLMVVVLIPVSYQLLGVHGADPTQPAVLDVQPLGLVLLLTASAAGMFALRRLGVPNPWVLGALLVTAALTASGITPSALPRWLGCVAAGTLAMMAASAGFAWLLALWVNQHPATLLLATAPGGIAEMCITAKVLQLGVPVVTAFHVVRYVAVLTLTAPLYRWEIARR